MRESLQEYLEILKGQNKAQGTLQQYSGGLRAFDRWLDEEDVEPEDLTTRDIQRYLSWLNRQGYAPKTVRGYFSPVSGYYADLKAAGEIDEDPTNDVVVADYASEETMKERLTKERRVYLTKDELGLLVENVPAPAIRNRLLVLFQYFTGLRRQEVSDVKLADLNREERRVRVRGKGNKLNTVHWKPKLDGLLTAWLDGGHRKASTYARKSEYLFLSNTAPKLKPDRINKVVVEAAENAGMQEVLYEDAAGRQRYKYTSHALRHSHAMHWMENGGSLEGLSKHMAHSSVTTTEIYEEVQQDRVSEEYEKYGPDIELTF